MLPDSVADVICGSNLVTRAQQGLVVDALALGRFLELSSLLEMLVLADRVCYFGDSSLRGTLVQSFPGVFTHCDASDRKRLLEETQAAHQFQQLLEHAFGGPRVQVSAMEVLEVGVKRRLDDDVILEYRRQVGQQFGPPGGGLFGWLERLATAGNGGSVEVRYLLRTFLYEAVARSLGISSAQDGLRLPLAVAANARTARLNFGIYWGLSASLKSIACPDGAALYVRPIPAIVLSRCKGQRAAAVTAAAELREEFSEFRSSLRELAAVEDSGATILEKERSRQEMQEASRRLLEEVARVGKSESWLAGLASNLYRPLRLYSGGASDDEVRGVVRRAAGKGGAGKLAAFSRMVKEFLSIPNYEGLLRDAWPCTSFARGDPFNRALEASPAWLGAE